MSSSHGPSTAGRAPTTARSATRAAAFRQQLAAPKSPLQCGLTLCPRCSAKPNCRHTASVCLYLRVTASQVGASPAQRSLRDFLLQLGHALPLADSPCSQAGEIVCATGCYGVILCVSNGQGGFQEVVLETCTPATTRCSAEQGTCVTGPTACGADTTGSIPCHSLGYFPDPYNCSVFHFCSELYINSQRMVCAAGHAYNPLTSDCSFLTSDPVCTSGPPVPACASVGQSGALATNPSIYYVCTVDANNVLIPSLYKCDNGEIYDAPTYTTTTSSSAPIPGTPCSPPLIRVADPDDCTRYYECSENWTWVHAACTYGTYYNPVHNRCEFGFC
ncbi:uncharacterized protein LOC124803179 [Schistocerca piceifrons]|uniref:uncharacterized protein LOC124803179 n=1 Tax=Schistocerca piceifrons TaxID=274613 RepID=UPI001F5F96DD|nr:uncharacterized protein LOC124803179 [Schistocerca piceifrons]